MKRILSKNQNCLLRPFEFLAIVILSILLSCETGAWAETIYEIQYTEDVSGDSPYLGQQVSIEGVVTSVCYYGYFVTDAPGAWNAIFVYSYLNSPEVGDRVSLTGIVAEFNNMTELANITSFSHISSGNSITSTGVSLADASQEQYEAVMLTVYNVDVDGLLSYGEWTVSDGIDTLICDDQSDYQYFPKVGDHLDSLTGVLSYTYGAFKLQPRTAEDVEVNPAPQTYHYCLMGDVVTMNDNKDIIQDGYLEIVGNSIAGIYTSAPKGVGVFEVNGLIFPGLIDAHNHPPYNALGIIPFGQRFTERYEWQATPLYNDFSTQRISLRDYGGSGAQTLNVWKTVEVRALSAGTTAMQGGNYNGDGSKGFAFPGIGVNNIGRFPDKVYSDTFPLDRSVSFWQEKSSEYWDRFVIHLSEGTTAAALDEFQQWKSMGMLDDRTTIVHGIPYGRQEWTDMANAGASLVWSPVSNLRLYGQTADIPGALVAGVNVAIAPDWTPSGTRNVLEELQRGWEYSKVNWGDIITPLEFVEFVTRNAAVAMGVDSSMGQISPGLKANLMVIPALSSHSPYESVLKAKPADVKLTIVEGRPMYWDNELSYLFRNISDAEKIQVGCREKNISIQVEAHSIPESEKPFTDALDELEEAYAASTPQISSFVGVEYGLCADTNADCATNLSDLREFSDQWLYSGGFPSADFNGDGFVNLRDFAMLALEWLSNDTICVR